PPCVGAVGECPVASPLARYQAASGSRVTNLRHEVIDLSAEERQLLPLLNGGHTMVELDRALSPGPGSEGPGQLVDLSNPARSLEAVLPRLINSSLLLG